MMAAVILAALLQSDGLGTFFSLPDWMPDSVEDERTYGSESATNGSLRIDATSLAAVNACFEGFCERSYYFSEGFADQWDEDEYGPKDRKLFWFKPGPVFDYGTNRTITTARFVDTDNLIDLAHALSTYELGIEDATTANRPSWDAGRSVETRRFWSSSSFGPFLGDIAFALPSYERWTTDPLRSFTEDDFKAVAASWGAFARNRTDPLSWTSRGAEFPYKPFMRTVFDRLHFGQPPFDSEMTYDPVVPPTWTSTNTVMDAASSVWGEPNGPVYEWVETNVTFRFGSVEEVESQIREDFESLGSSRPMSGLYYAYLYPFREVEINGTSYYEPPEDEAFGDHLYLTLYRIDLLVRFNQSFQHQFRHGSYYIDNPNIKDFRNGTASLTQEIPIEIFVATSKITQILWNGWQGTQWTNENSVFTVDCDAYVFKGMSSDSNNQIPALTNDTRRLFSDRCAAIGQSLSLLDKSFSRLNPSYDADGTNVEFTATGLFKSDVNQVSIVWPSGSMGGFPEEAKMSDDFILGGLEEVAGTRNYTNSVARSWNPSLPMESHLAVRQAGLVGAHIDPETSPTVYQEITEYDVTSSSWSYYLSPGDEMVITPNRVSVSYYNGRIIIDCYGDIDDIPGYGPFEGVLLFGSYFDLPTTVPVYAEFTPNFWYAAATGFHGLPSINRMSGGLHPSGLGLELTGDAGAGLWTMGDVFLSAGSANDPVKSIPSEIAYASASTRSQSANYHTERGAYKSFSDGQALFRQHYSAFRTKFNELKATAFSGDVFSPGSIFDRWFNAVSGGSVRLLKSKTTFPVQATIWPFDDATPGAKPNKIVRAFRVKCGDDGRSFVEEVLVQTGDVTAWEEPEFPYVLSYFIISVATSDARAEYGDIPPFGYSIGTKLESWTDTDWNWNALRLERNNQ